MGVLPKVVTHNATLKAAALVGAVFLWAIAPTDRTQSESLTSVPVRVQVADLNWALAEQPFPSEVEVRFSGPTRDLIRLAREGTSVRIPIQAVAASDTSITLRRDWVVIDGASGLVVEEILPSQIQLSFEPVVSAALAVELRTEGTLPEGFALAQPLGVTPAVVRARGPARILDEVDSIPTVVLDLRELSASGVRNVPIDTVGLGGILLDPREVSVGVRLDAAVDRIFPTVPLVLTGPGAEEYEVEVQTLSVTLRAAEVRFQSAVLDSLRLVIDTRDIGLLGIGESRQVDLTVMGVPDLIQAIPERTSVTVSRPDLGGPAGLGDRGGAAR